MLTGACVLYLLALYVPISWCSTFYFSRNAFRRSDECSLCYEKDCLALDQSRCDYYAEADAVLPKDDEEPGTADKPELRREVDDFMFDLVDKVAGVSNNMECIPYVSRYTNCNKDNVCLGCKNCLCDGDGRWQCTVSASCHTQELPLKIDHRVLVMVMGTLIESSHSKKVKRSAGSNSENSPTIPSTITLEQLSEWLYGAQPISFHEQDIDTTTTATTEAKTYNTDTDYLEFDEVLRSIAVDTKSYNRRKSLDYKFDNQSFNFDYMISDEDNVTSGNANSDNLVYMLKLRQADDTATESSISETTKVIIDLLSAAEQAKSNRTEGNTAFNKDIEMNALENSNDVIDYNAINIVKREVTEQNKVSAPSAVPVVTIIVNTTNNTKDNNTGELPINFKDSVLVPLNKIIVDKIRELENLKRIKENLAIFVKTDGELTEDVENSTGNTFFSIYNLVMDPGKGVNARRSNAIGQDRLMLKLKGDVFEVIRDITSIQRRKGTNTVPDDLNYLFHSMKRYVYKNQWEDNKVRIKVKKSVKKGMKNSRRQMNDDNAGRCTNISYKDCLIRMIELIDKDSPKSNALSALSPTSRRIMKHVIKSLYVDELAVMGTRVRDPNYNLTNDLLKIGIQWREITANLIGSTPFACLFRMKLLHFVLTSDISKMNDALGLIDFSHSRRMLPSLDNVNSDVIDTINVGLTAIHNKIQMLVRYYSQKPNSSETVRPRPEVETTTKPVKNTTDPKKKKSRSFIKHIRSLLKTSKKDIAELLRRKVPKSEIVKQLAKKKFSEISAKRYNEYEEAMKKWQKNLDLVTSRNKRSVLNEFSARMKNIIPRYLRHKVNPKIKAKQEIATANATRLADDRKKKRMSLRRGRMKRISTTPKTNSANGNAPKTMTTK